MRSAAVARHLPRWLVDAHPSERRLHRILLVPQVISLLDAVGWNAFIGRRRGSGSTREVLRAIERSTRGNIAAHGVGAGVHLVVGIACAIGGARMRRSSSSHSVPSCTSGPS